MKPDCDRQTAWLNRHARTLLAWPLLALAVLAAACTQDGAIDQTGSFTSSWVRPEDPREQIGAREHPLVVAKYGGEFQDEQAEKLLAVIVGKLVAVSDDPDSVYRVTILDSPKVNAFALPGGYLYVTRGLLALANDSAEVAAVIAHEMAHVSANHAIVRQEKLSSNQLGQRVVSEVLGDSASARVALAASQLRLSNFSREQELQADAVGIRMIGRAGYDPFAAARFLETLQRYRALSSGEPRLDVAFLSSHPGTPQRIELARRHARFFGAPGVGLTDRDRYLQGIDGLLFGDAAEEGFVRGRTFSHSGLAITFSVPEGFRIDNQPKAIVVTGQGGIATRFDATVIDRRSSLTDYMKSGWINGLDEASIAQDTINGLDSAHAAAQAEGWRFHVRVLRIGTQLYRFITAARPDETELASISDAITGSFRKLTRAEIRELTPLKIQLVTLEEGQTLATLAGRMAIRSNQMAMLRLINGLSPGEEPPAGTRLKIISN